MPVSNSQKQFQENMKKTALGLKFGKKLFTNPSSLNPAQITQILVLMGADIPKDVQVGVEAAQLIVAGGTAYETAKTAESATDIQTATNQTAASIRLLSKIAERQKWLDQDSASIISIGADATMLIASGGADATAWVSLAADLAQVCANKAGIAEAQAVHDLQNNFNKFMVPQKQAAARLILDLQNSRISIYGYLAGIAAESPASWPQLIDQNSKLKEYFPELNFVPIVTGTIKGYGSSEMWGEWPWPLSGRYVLSRTESSRELNYTTLAGSFTKDGAAEFIFNLLLKPWIVAYQYANNEIVGGGNASIATTAVLSMIAQNPGSAEISSSYDYVQAMIGANLTPIDLGEKNIMYKISDEYVSQQLIARHVDQTFHEAGVSTGKENPGLRISSEAHYNVKKEVSRILKSGNIQDFANFAPFKQSLQEYFDFQTLSFEKDPTLGGQLNKKFTNPQVTSWRKISNFIAVMNVISQFRHDSYLKDTPFAQNVAPYIPDAADFDARFKSLSSLSLARNMQILTKREISFYTGIPVSKLVKLNETGPAKYGSK